MNDLFHEVDHAGDVRVDVGARVLDGVANPGLRGEMEHVGEFAGVERLANGVLVVQVRLEGVHAEGLELGESRAL